MTTLTLTTMDNDQTVDGFSYHLTRQKIHYTILKKIDCIEVWKQNDQRGSLTLDCFYDGINQEGKKMAKFLKQALTLIS